MAKKPAAKPAEAKPATDGEQLEALAAAPDETAADDADLDFHSDERELGADGSEGWRWYLSRYLANGKGREECTTYAVGSISIDQLREEWGPGRYYARLRGPTGLLKRHHVFTLAAPRAAIAPASSSSDQLSGFLRELDTRLAAMARPAERPPGLDAAQLLDIAGKLADRMAPPPQQRSELDTFLKYFEIFDKLRGADGDATNTLIKEGFTTARPLLEALTTRLGGAPANGAAPEGNGTKQPEPRRAALENPPMLELVNWLQHQVRYLIPKARAGSSASLYAELMLDNLPAGVTADMVLSALQQQGALDKLFNVLPNDDRIAAQTVRPWFEELRTELVGFLVALKNPAPDDTPDDKGGEKSDTPAA